MKRLKTQNSQHDIEIGEQSQSTDSLWFQDSLQSYHDQDRVVLMKTETNDLMEKKVYSYHETYITTYKPILSC